MNASDPALIARVRLGDVAAVADLYRRHGPGLLRLAERLTGAREDAEEVVQDVFVGLPLALRRYEETGRLGAWLRRITARLALDLITRNTRRREESLDEMLAGGERSLDTQLADRLTIEQAVKALPATLRVVVVLRLVEQYTHAEIAEMLGIRRGTAEVRFHRGLMMLRKVLGDDR